MHQQVCLKPTCIFKRINLQNKHSLNPPPPARLNSFSFYSPPLLSTRVSRFTGGTPETPFCRLRGPAGPAAPPPARCPSTHTHTHPPTHTRNPHTPSRPLPGRPPPPHPEAHGHGGARAAGPRPSTPPFPWRSRRPGPPRLSSPGACAVAARRGREARRTGGPLLPLTALPFGGHVGGGGGGWGSPPPPHLTALPLGGHVGGGRPPCWPQEKAFPPGLWQEYGAISPVQPVWGRRTGRRERLAAGQSVASGTWRSCRARPGELLDDWFKKKKITRPRLRHCVSTKIRVYRKEK